MQLYYDGFLHYSILHLQFLLYKQAFTPDVGIEMMPKSIYVKSKSIRHIIKCWRRIAASRRLPLPQKCIIGLLINSNLSDPLTHQVFSGRSVDISKSGLHSHWSFHKHSHRLKITFSSISFLDLGIMLQKLSVLSI